MRMSKVLGEIKDSKQTSYVKGRSVADNLRSMMFLNVHCMEEQIEAVIQPTLQRWDFHIEYPDPQSSA